MHKENSLEEYRPIVGDAVIEKIKKRAKKLKNKHIVCVSSTHTGGGVAEMLNAMIPILNDLGVPFGWRILHGTNNFFEITKSIHNAVQGEPFKFTDAKKQIYEETNERFAKFTHLNHDLVVVHDPQPLPMIAYYAKEQPWILRIHPDFSSPDKKTYNYLKKYINMYDQVIVSKKEFTKKGIKPPQSIIYPAIDPLSPKNMELTTKERTRELAKKGIRKDKLLITEVSRFDKWKGFPGLIRAFEIARKDIDARLVLCGSYASDDPEGVAMYQKIVDMVRRSKYKKDIQIVFGDKELFVNALQAESDIVVQNSAKEGFGLTVAEALYKKTPVVATRVGGIPLQVEHGKNGYLVRPNETKKLAKYLVKLGESEELRKKMGQNGKEHVVKNFLITRLMLDWMEIFVDYLVFPNNIGYLGNRLITKLTNGNGG
ncbi:MAG: glycosyltransferase [Patescibacteria group bacterium]|nr:glycosyltransferase [Patescibacteria group bacterium]